MIKLTKFNSKTNKKGEFILNAEIIETIEETPDTVITLTNGKKLIVDEPMDEIDALFAEVKVYGRQEDTTQFSAACAHLASLLDAMGESHGCYWWNVM